MDTALDQDADDRRLVEEFYHRVKSSSAYLQTNLLNIEELYGLADMAVELSSEKATALTSLAEARQESKTARDALSALNRMIYFLARDAGKEFLEDSARRRFSEEVIGEALRESHSEDPIQRNLGSRYTNLMAYLCLAGHKDANGSAPLFIQFNWDLALDRALFRRQLNLGNQPEHSNDRPAWYDFDSSNNDQPIIARPHGGVNWFRRELMPNTPEFRKFRPFRNFYPQEDIKAEASSAVLVDWSKIGEGAFGNGYPEAGQHEVDRMAIVPPTWRKQAELPAYQAQWAKMREVLANVKNLVFVGYSLPPTDLYFRHFLALALGDNQNNPKVYVWNPGLSWDADLRATFEEMFLPLAHQDRLLGITSGFGDPGLFELNRALHLARPFRALTTGN